MGIGFAGVIGRSVVKALKNTGAAVVTAGGTAIGITLANPEIMAPIWASTGFVGPVALILLSVTGQTIVDYLKHKDQA